MSDRLRSILTRLVAYVAIVIAAGLLFLAGASVYQLMWPRPVVPLSQMSHRLPGAFHAAALSASATKRCRIAPITNCPPGKLLSMIWIKDVSKFCVHSY